MPKRTDLGDKLKELIADHPLPLNVRKNIASSVMSNVTHEERQRVLAEAWAEFDETLDVLRGLRVMTKPNGAAPTVIDGKPAITVQEALKALKVDADWLLTVLP